MSLESRSDTSSYDDTPEHTPKRRRVETELPADLTASEEHTTHAPIAPDFSANGSLTAQSDHGMALETGESGSELESGSESESEADSETEAPEDLMPAQAGWIKRLELFNFMCHDHFELDLHPQINFIIGRNGAGKLAILTGLLVAFGVRATESGRGASIKDLIKQGRQTARVRVTLANEGAEAYQPHVYGDSITIERKITHTVAGYTILSAAGKVVLKKKGDVAKILKAFTITADNPMAFLSQDRAREFLTLANDQKKYQYFRLGACITETEDNYMDLAGLIEQIHQKYSYAQRHLEVVTEDYRRLREEYRAYDNLARMRRRLDLLHGKMYWFTIANTEKRLEQLRNEVGTNREYIEAREREIAKTNDDKTSRDVELKSLSERREEAKAAMQQAKFEAQEVATKVDRMNSSLEEKLRDVSDEEASRKRTEGQIKLFEEKLVHEQQRLEREGNLTARLEEEKRELQLRFKELKVEETQLLDEQAELKEPDVSGLREEANNVRKQLFRLEQQKLQPRDKYAPWGPQMRQLVAAVEREKGWTHRPIGPLGLHIQLTPRPGYESKQWRDVILTVLNKSLDLWLCHNENDRRLLQNCMRSVNRQFPVLTRQLTNTFDFSHGIPRGQVTFVDMLKVNDPVVLCALVDLRKVEKLVLGDDALAAQVARAHNVDTVFLLRDHLSARAHKAVGGAGRTDPVYFSEHHAQPKLAMPLGGDNRAEIAELKAQLKEIEDETNGARSSYLNKASNLKASIAAVRRKISEVEGALFRLDEKMSLDLTLKVENIKRRIADERNKLQTQQEAIAGLEADYHDYKSERDELVQELERRKAIYVDAKRVSEERTAAALDFETEVEVLKTSIHLWTQEIATAQQTIAHLEAKIGVGESKLIETTTKALEICPREEVELSETDTKELITAEYDLLNHEVEEAELRLARPMHECQVELEAALDAKALAQEVTQQLKESYERLHNDLNQRWKYFQEAVRNKERAARRAFSHALSLRGYHGLLNIDLVRKTLLMQVRASTDKKVRGVLSLLGGEKLYTQISLLLAIWNVMDSKIRGLDEFDVFMDSVNRLIAIKLLLQELRKYPKSQSIFITPQDIAVVGDLDRPDVRIHKMRDPRTR